MCHNPPLVRNKPLGAPASVKLVSSEQQMDKSIKTLNLQSTMKLTPNEWIANIPDWHKEIKRFIITAYLFFIFFVFSLACGNCLCLGKNL